MIKIFNFLLNPICYSNLFVHGDSVILDLNRHGPVVRDTVSLMPNLEKFHLVNRSISRIFFSELKIDGGGDDQLSSFHSESSQQDFPNKNDFNENIEIYFRDFIKIHHDTKALVNIIRLSVKP